LFKIGDNIFYPMHGAGKIESLEEKDFAGKKQPYYTIQMLIGDLKVMIPMRKISKTMIRPVKELCDVKEIASSIKEQATENKLPWKQRYKANMDKIKSGSLEDSAEVVHALLQMQKESKLNSSERSMLIKAQNFLKSELKLIDGMNKYKIEQFLLTLSDGNTAVS